MKVGFYRMISRLGTVFGPQAFSFFARLVAGGYFVLLPSRRRISVDFYQTLYPDRGKKHALGCAWKQYQRFTTVFLDRYRHLNREDLAYRSEGWHYIRPRGSRPNSGILLMSHLGNWEIAAHILQNRLKGQRLLLYMGAKQREQIEGLQKSALRDSGIRVIAVDETGGSPFNIIEGARWLQMGGLVSMTGDRLWQPGGRTVAVTFLNRRARLPEAPYVLALLAKRPIYVFFAVDNGDHYRFISHPPIEVSVIRRSDRRAAIADAAQQYASLLEQMVRRYPSQWYHFEPFLEARDGDRPD